MIDRATGQFGRLDILVNNAGVTHKNMPLTEVGEADFDRINDVNMKAVYHACQIAVPIMAAQGAARSFRPPRPPGCARAPALSGTMHPRPG